MRQMWLSEWLTVNVLNHVEGVNNKNIAGKIRITFWNELAMDSAIIDFSFETIIHMENSSSKIL